MLGLLLLSQRYLGHWSLFYLSVSMMFKQNCYFGLSSILLALSCHLDSPIWPIQSGLKIFFFWLLLLFGDRNLLCIPGWPLTQYIAQTDLEFAILLLWAPSQSRSPLLGSRVCTAVTPAPENLLFVVFWLFFVLLRFSASVCFRNAHDFMMAGCDWLYFIVPSK